jgi:hypothetical protein
MSLPKVDIQLQNGQLGRVTELGNGVPGLVVLMAASPTGHAFGDTKAYSSFEDLPEELQAIEAIELFYKTAGDRKIFIMPVVNTTTVKEVVNGQAVTPYAKNLLSAAQGEIRFFAVLGDLVLADLPEALTNLQALLEAEEAKYNPVLGILPYNYADDDVYPDLTQRTDNRCGVVQSPDGDELGLLLGRLASIPVQRNAARVKDGALPVVTAKIGSKNIEDEMDLVEAMHDKGYICLRTHIGKSGYFFTYDPLATDPAEDYSFIANRRVIDKALLIAYGVYIENLLDEIPITEAGLVAPGIVKELQGSIENAINQQMTANDEISSVSAFVDDQQDVLATGKVEIVLSVVPVGYAKEIIVKLGFSNPSNE